MGSSVLAGLAQMRKFLPKVPTEQQPTTVFFYSRSSGLFAMMLRMTSFTVHLRLADHSDKGGAWLARDLG